MCAGIINILNTPIFITLTYVHKHRIQDTMSIVYKEIWDAVVGEELECERDTTNYDDRFAVAVRIKSQLATLPENFRLSSLYF